METESRVAVIGIVVDQTGDTEELNKVLHQYGQYIVGRMGIPYHKRNVNIISVVIDAPGDVISALSGKLGCCGGFLRRRCIRRRRKHRNENEVTEWQILHARDFDRLTGGGRRSVQALNR